MRVLLADRQAKIRSALRLLLAEEPGVQVIGEADDAGALPALVEAAEPDLLLIDWALLQGRSSAFLAALRARAPRLKVIVLSSTPEAAVGAFQAGADEFISMVEAPGRLMSRVRAISDRMNGDDRATG